jgi:NAD(P)-dependent dehydrogenase (short-subunit alcohol dehydrogenase family)
MDLGFKGKAALVTGAGSQIGFGKAIALLLAKEGCDAVAVNDINLEDAEKTAAAVRALGCQSIAIKADVTRKAEVQEMVKKASAEFGKIDILANVAGAILGTGPFPDQTEELWDKEIALNFKGTMLVTQAVLPGMLERKYGKIINISSGSIRAAFGVSTYTIAKGAVEIFTRHLAKDAIRNGVNINCVSPGWALTNFIKGNKEEAATRFLPGTPIGRGTTPEDIACAVAYFASDIASDVVGQVLDVTGGSTL